MGDQDTGQKSVEQQDQGSDNAQDQDSDNKPERAGQLAEKPEPDDSHREKAKEMAKAYDDIPTAVLPGSGGSVTGTAVNEWLDDEGNPKFGREDAKEDTKKDAKEDAKDEANAGSNDEPKAERRSDGGAGG